MMQTSKTTLRRASDDDVDRLVAWHADPDVSRYWDDETFTRARVPRAARPVDPYRWNESAVRAWGRAGFVTVSEHDPDDEHLRPWVLMEFRG